MAECVLVPEVLLSCSALSTFAPLLGSAVSFGLLGVRECGVGASRWAGGGVAEALLRLVSRTRLSDIISSLSFRVSIGSSAFFGFSIAVHFARQFLRVSWVRRDETQVWRCFLFV